MHVCSMNGLQGLQIVLLLCAAFVGASLVPRLRRASPKGCPRAATVPAARFQTINCLRGKQVSNYRLSSRNLWDLKGLIMHAVVFVGSVYHTEPDAFRRSA